MYNLEFLEDDKVSRTELGFKSFNHATSRLREVLKNRMYSEDAIIQAIYNKENYEDKDNDFHSIRTHYSDKEKYLSLESCRGHEAYRVYKSE